MSKHNISLIRIQSPNDRRNPLSAYISPRRRNLSPEYFVAQSPASPTVVKQLKQNQASLTGKRQPTLKKASLMSALQTVTPKLLKVNKRKASDTTNKDHECNSSVLPQIKSKVKGVHSVRRAPYDHKAGMNTKRQIKRTARKATSPSQSAKGTMMTPTQRRFLSPQTRITDK